ncbi:hypothetical protein, partial [Thiolapillus sp.]|uniref:hypothetical protein n=1 Tax=Thiolapillus sp. TaxID=2017437 RepID=UPI003AF8BC0B
IPFRAVAAESSFPQRYRAAQFWTYDDWPIRTMVSATWFDSDPDHLAFARRPGTILRFIDRLSTSLKCRRILRPMARPNLTGTALPIILPMGLN